MSLPLMLLRGGWRTPFEVESGWADYRTWRSQILSVSLETTAGYPNLRIGLGVPPKAPNAMRGVPQITVGPQFGSFTLAVQKLLWRNANATEWAW